MLGLSRGNGLGRSGFQPLKGKEKPGRTSSPSKSYRRIRPDLRYLWNDTVKLAPFWGKAASPGGPHNNISILAVLHSKARIDSAEGVEILHGHTVRQVFDLHIGYNQRATNALGDTAEP
jgi:hypothetical protein